MNQRQREGAIRAMRDGTLDVEAIPPALYPPGWVSRTQMFDGPKRMTLKYLVVLFQSAEGLSYKGARARIAAMVSSGTLRKVSAEDGTEVYEVIPTSEVAE